MSFLAGLFVVSAASLIYQILLTRLLSVTAWYYLAFVAVSLSMFGLTAGALIVHLRAAWFTPALIPRRLTQWTLAMAVSIPLTLLTMLSVPLEIAMGLQTFYSFLLFSAIIAVPLVLGGVVVCLCLTRCGRPIGPTYAVDLAGATSGCFLALVFLSTLDAPSALLALSAVVFVAAAFFAQAAGSRGGRYLLWAGVMALAAIANASTLYGIQPIWSKGRIDPRDDILAEIWNPISRVRVHPPVLTGAPLMGPSPLTPAVHVDTISLEIDNGAATWITRYGGNPAELDVFRYDVTALADNLRAGGSIAVIGVGGGRDVLAAAAFGFKRILGIEVNPAVLGLSAGRFEAFSGLRGIPGVELVSEEGRSCLTRSPERFDIIQASLVDTWAGTAAGAMTLTENALYTVEGWRIFYSHLTPGGMVSFSRWSNDAESYQSRRLFALAWAALLSEGVTDPGKQIAFLGSGRLATLIMSNQPFSAGDLASLSALRRDLRFTALFFPGERPADEVLRTIAATRAVAALSDLRDRGNVDYSPPFDDSPFFFNAVRLSSLWRTPLLPVLLGKGTMRGGNLRALAFLVMFLLAAVVLVTSAILWPLHRYGQTAQAVALPFIGYFISIGLGFMLVEMGMIQQLGLFLGQPIYAMMVVLAGLIASAGCGSALSARLRTQGPLRPRGPSAAAAAIVVLYTLGAPYVTTAVLPAPLLARVFAAMALVALPGLVMGMCLPVGVRVLTDAGKIELLPWMWALNGAASVLATFVAVVIAMQYGIVACLLTGSAFYLCASALISSADAATIAPVLPVAA